MGLKEVVIESDAMNVISALQQRKKNWSPLFHLLEDIRCLVPWINSLLSSHVKQE